MHSSSRGIATTILVIGIVAIIAVAGAAVYLSGALTPSSNTTGTHSSTATSTHSGSTSTSSASTSSSSSSSSSSTSTSSTSSTSSQSTTSTASTFSCTATYSTTTSGTQVDYTPQYINLAAKFSAITFSIQGTTNGSSSQNSSISYHTTVVSSGIYDVNFTFTSQGSGSTSGVARVDSNNESVISVTFSSYTFYGAQAKSFFDSFMALFGLEETFGGYLSVFTSSAYFHSTGTAPMTFGSTTFDVTTWVANSLPLMVNQCGYAATITAFSLQVGTPPGTSLLFITNFHFASSSPQNEDVTLKLVSMTVA